LRWWFVFLREIVPAGSTVSTGVFDWLPPRGQWKFREYPNPIGTMGAADPQQDRDHDTKEDHGSSECRYQHSCTCREKIPTDDNGEEKDQRLQCDRGILPGVKLPQRTQYGSS
jgi:hypothetical protein